MGMSQQLKQFSKDTLLYGLGNTLQKFIALLLFPIYTRVLTKQDFGSQDLVLTVYTILFVFMILGLDNGAARDYYDADTPSKKSCILSTWLWFELIISVPVCITLIAFAQPLCIMLFNNITLTPLFSIGMALVPFAVVSKVTLMVLRLTFQSYKFMFLTTSYVLFIALSTIQFVVISKQGAKGILLSYLVANILQMICGLVLTHRHFSLTFSKTQLRSMLAFGLPALPASLSLWILNSSNRYYLARLATLGDVGLLSVGMRISTMLSFILSAFQIAWPPFAFSLIKDAQLAKQTYSKVLTYFLLLSLLVGVPVGLFARELLLLLTTQVYESAAYVVPWLCYGAIILGVADIVGIGYSIMRKSYHITLATILGAVFSTGLNIYLIPLWSVIGAAVATMSGGIAILIYNYFAGQHYFWVSYEFVRIAKLVCLASVTSVVGILIDHNFVMWSPKILFYKLSLYIAFVISLFVLRVIDSRACYELLLSWRRERKIID